MRPPTVTLETGNCLEVLRLIPDASVDSVVTDPPYNLAFMGKGWDDLGREFQSWCAEWSRECLRVLRPGGHLLAFGGSRTWHRLASGVEDGGFEMRDSLAWIYGSGMPKSLDASKAVDKLLGAEREILGTIPDRWGGYGDVLTMAEQRNQGEVAVLGGPATPEAALWDGWGTGLKPAFEPVAVGRKPLASRTIAQNLLDHGAGALNLGACRIGSEARVNPAAGNKPGGASLNMSAAGMPADALPRAAEGRWPANVILSEDQAEILGDEVARYFYCSKAPARERPYALTEDGRRIAHPTVKPVDLMRWLVRLVTPVGGLVLDPFAGSGATGEAAVLEGMDAFLIEREPDYAKLIRARLEPYELLGVDLLTDREDLIL